VKLAWSPNAIEDLRALQAYIERDAPLAARKTAQGIIEAVETMIPDNPRVGRPGRAPGTRELVIAGSPYIVPYRLRDGTIEILRVFHGARRWPDRL
jgi:toxin ParE1/3/4